jgi:AcrR family transcriptional regulator
MIISPYRPTDPNNSTARDRLMTTADQLFYSGGVRATGIDRIIAESGVAKMSFYRHFPSKSDLVVSFLADRHLRWMAWFSHAMERHGVAQDLGAIADALQEWFQDPGFRGCAFINVLAEFPEAEAREHREAVAHKVALQHEIERYCSPATAAKVMILIEGSIVRAQMGFGAEAVAALRDMLKLIS